MDADSIVAWKRAEPFRPFVLHLDSGEEVGVEHPEDLTIVPDNPTLVVFGRYQGVDLIDHAAVTTITPLERPTLSDNRIAPPRRARRRPCKLSAKRKATRTRRGRADLVALILRLAAQVEALRAQVERQAHDAKR